MKTLIETLAWAATLLLITAVFITGIINMRSQPSTPITIFNYPLPDN